MIPVSIDPAWTKLAGTELLLDALAGRADVTLDDPHEDALAAPAGAVARRFAVATGQRSGLTR
ncbi:hypothetical protein I545_6960 [Mycobacterium kansasii 662]|uniref:Uncharacterized protein n=1 Tax=Mycobacterium kansasii 662 TaxID=1299326 RepID=X7XQQ6_MYCKA|nr:hypothetical protein I545_6960 [Mycobacterium kansasii 662]